MKRIQSSVALVGIALILTLAAPVMAAPDSPNATQGGTLVVAIATDPETLNGAMTTSTPATTIASGIYDTLIITDAEGNPTPNLATSWDVSSDAKTYTFHLVENATWHDGEPFTSADVKFTAEEVWKVHHPRNSLALQNLDRVDTPDDYTAVFEFSEPYAALLGSLGNYDGFVIPEHIYAGTDIADNPHNLDDPIGTGPFIFEEFVTGEQVTLTRNPNYWRADGPYLDRVIFRVIPEPAARGLAIRTGEVDLIPISALPPRSDLDGLKEQDGVVVHETDDYLLAGASVLMFNLRRDVTADLAVRQAFAYTLDRQLLVDRVMFGYARVADGPFGGTWYDDEAVTKYPRDVDKANELLDAAGYAREGDGTRFELNLLYDQARDATAQTAEVIREQMAEVGVTVNLMGSDRATSEQSVFIDHDFDLAIPAEFPGTGPVPDVGIARFYKSSNIGEGIFNNAAAYENPIVDAAFEDASATSDTEERRALFSTVQEEVTRDLPYLWMIAPTGVTIYRDSYANVEWTDPYELDLASIYVISDEATDAGSTDDPNDGDVTTGDDDEGSPGMDPLLVGGLIVVVLALGGWFVVGRRRST